MPTVVLRALAKNIPTVAPVPHRNLLSVSGSQASEFLNGIVSSLVHEPLKRPIYSAFIHAQGRILYDVFLYTSTDSAGKSSYLIEYDPRPSEAPPLLSLLKRYVLRAKVKIRDVSEQYDIWAAWGDSTSELHRQWTWARSGVAEPTWGTTEWPWGTKDESIMDRRAPGMGKRFLVQKGVRPQETSNYELATSDAYTLHRILHGVPEGQTDLPPMQAFPTESNLDIMGGLDFRKGCYVGQELAVRTYHTGIVRKRILPICIHKPGEKIPSVVTPSLDKPFLPANTSIQPSVVNKPDAPRAIPRPRGAGKLLSSLQGVGLALLRLEHVDAVGKGDLMLGVNVEHGENQGQWALTPSRPDWWPSRTEEP